MNFTLKNKSSGVLTFYVVVGVPLLVLLYFAFSYLALNLFLGVDLSVFGRLAPGGWPGYALLGLGLGAAAGAIAAQHRYRLHKALVGSAIGVALGLGALVLITTTIRAAPDAQEATAFVAQPNRLQCPACATPTASSTKPTQNDNSYEAANLLDKNDATAWISDASAAGTALPGQLPKLELVVNIPAGQQLVGVRVRNGYGKNSAVYRSFSRVQLCSVGLAGGEQTLWLLPDERNQESFIPVPATSQSPAKILVSIEELYAGENHAEVALSALSPVLESTAP